jgi:hypothetical protein
MHAHNRYEGGEENKAGGGMTGLAKLGLLKKARKQDAE